MALALYAHPFSSYCQKALIALYENNTPFEYKLLAPDQPAIATEFAALWPLKKFPLLLDNGKPVMEASIIIEYLDLYHRGPVRLLPDDAKAALEVRLLDRFFDNYIMTPMQKLVGNQPRPAEQRDAYGVSEARAQLDTAYQWLDGRLVDRTWVAGNSFSLADCAAAPSLFYADWAHEIDATLKNVRTYRARLLARPSFARAVDEARPYQAYFPLGAPDRD
jgi:glutathione S-transferase